MGMKYDHVQKHEPHKGYKPFANYEPRFVKDQEGVDEAFKHYKRIHEVHNKVSDYGLEITSKLMKESGEDYVGKKDAAKLARALRKHTSAKVIGDYFGVQDENVTKQLEDYLTNQLIGPESDIRRQLERGERVDFEQIKSQVQNVMSHMRSELLKGVYTELQDNEKKAVAQEVTTLLYHYIGGPDQESRIKGLKKLRESRHVVEELAGLDRVVANAFEQVKRSSTPPEKK